MKKRILFAIFGFIIITLTGIQSCKKKTSELQEELASISNTQSHKWGANDDKYLSALKKFSTNFKNIYGKKNNTSSFCISNGPDSSFGWFADPDQDIVDGPYVLAKAGPYESNAANCPELISLAWDAHVYLLVEGYSDISGTYDQSDSKFHAANTLLHLKHESNQFYFRTKGAWNWLLQAIGYAAITELLSDWATLSRQKIIRRFGKIVSKNMGFFGAIIAIASFIDCITD